MDSDERRLAVTSLFNDCVDTAIEQGDNYYPYLKEAVLWAKVLRTLRGN